MEKQVSNHKQANLFKSTHKLIDEITETLKEKGNHKGKVSKADVVDDAIKAMHRKVVKK
ncbi:hypothetical protein VP199E371_P0029 [Vibrio phage 199E37-1]|nr:hypothetical protein VP199E371_P0029 [Vibrio phage 199E37-1]